MVFIGEGKGADALDPFWKRLGRSGFRIEAVAIDMSQAYIHAVRSQLPDATLVFDRFHVVKLMNDKHAALRRTLQRQAEDEAKTVLKGTRWLLPKNPVNLSPEHNDAERLKAALEGTNNKIKTLQRDAYGFRDQEFFHLRIFALHESRYALVG